MRKLLLTLVLLFAVFIVSISQTSAQTIYACVNRGSGIMRYVSGPGQCRGQESEISWNVQGIQGEKGDKGDKGDTGTPGADGHSPVLTWSGDQIAIDGSVTGPHLTGPQGPPGVANGITTARNGSFHYSFTGPIIDSGWPTYESYWGTLTLSVSATAHNYRVTECYKWHSVDLDMTHVTWLISLFPDTAGDPVFPTPPTCTASFADPSNSWFEWSPQDAWMYVNSAPSTDWGSCAFVYVGTDPPGTAYFEITLDTYGSDPYANDLLQRSVTFLCVQ